LEICCAEGGLEAAAIFEDVFASVRFGEAEVEDFFVAEHGDAAWAGAEAVDEPGEFGEGGDLEDAEAVGFLFGPVVDARSGVRAGFL